MEGQWKKALILTRKLFTSIPSAAGYLAVARKHSNALWRGNYSGKVGRRFGYW